MDTENVMKAFANALVLGLALIATQVLMLLILKNRPLGH